MTHSTAPETVGDSRAVEVPVTIPSAEHCRACTLKLREAVDAVPGVGSVAVDPATSVLTAEIDPSMIDVERLVAEVERAGLAVGSAIGHATWRLSGLDCPDCARTVDKSVSMVDGVLSASLNFASGVLFVEYDRNADPRGAIEDLVARMEYRIERMGDAAGRPVAEFRLLGLDCPDCAMKLEDRIADLSGVAEAAVDFNTARLRVGYDARMTDPPTLAAAITRAGYEVEPLEAEGVRAPGWLRTYRTELSTAFSGGLILIGWALEAAGAPAFASIAAFALAIVAGGLVIGRRALSSLKARSLDMNVLMTVAVIGAALIGEWAEGAMVVFLFSIGGLLESRSLARTRRSIRDLMDLSPQVAHRVGDSAPVDVPPDELSPGDEIVVRPGERVPLDAAVLEGSSAVDEAPITGEAVPVDKTPGDALYAGTLNTSGVLRARVTAVAADSTLARIVYLVEEAQAQQAPFQRLVDRFTRYYTPAVVALAAAVAIVPPLVGTALGAPWADIDEWVYRALVLLVVSCPCALVISTPVAIVSAITRATRDGVLIKGGAFLEIAPRIASIAFDKTGTLTYGRPDVTEVIPLNGVAPARIAAIAGALEANSTHPLAQAVTRHARGIDLSAPTSASDVVEEPGRGVRGTIDGTEYALGNMRLAEEVGGPDGSSAELVERLENTGLTVLVVTEVGGLRLGVIGIADRVRDDASAVVSELRDSGVSSVMLTGDNERAAVAIGNRAGVRDVRAQLLPQDKTKIVGELREKYGAVAMVGDGINDAPALARADIGIAMGAAGSDTALETADVALMTDDLSAIPGFLDLGRRTVANIRQNVWVSVGVKLAVLVAALFGYAPLWLAVFADTGVALLVILNGLRLLRAP